MTQSSNPPEKDSPLPRPELLAPAGDWDCIRAAIENGADAVYFGLDIGFNARARAANFPLEDLPRLMQTLHARGLKGYTTLNTLIFSDELIALEKVVQQIAVAGVDAVLVQDVGAARLIRAICPDLPLHASTQMTLTSAESIALAESLGMERVVLARELSIAEIMHIREKTSMPLEVFVHGALCVAYSGQCLTSESLGGRSANRGQCAQACRLPYDLVCDGKEVNLGNQKYLLSPQDLAAYALAPELIAAGICSFKIEGRLKTPEYVANITRHYRQALDHAVAGMQMEFSRQAVEEMELSFSRGFSTGWLQGNNHKLLVPGLSSAKRGVLLGEITRVQGERVSVRLMSSIKRGDGVSFEGGRAENTEQGGRVYEVFQEGRSVTEPVASGIVELAFAYHTLDTSQLRVGQRIWKTDDPELTSRLRKSWDVLHPQRRQPIDLEIIAHTGSPLKITARTEQGVTCELTSPAPLAPAREHPLTTETLRSQFGRLGGTAFELRDLTAEIVAAPMVPFSVLGKLRHALVEQLAAACQHLPERRIRTEPILADWQAVIRKTQSQESSTKLIVLCRSLDQLRNVLEQQITDVYVDFSDIRQYREAVALANTAHAQIWLATPRIQKPDELGIFHALAKHAATGILVRNFGGLRYFTNLNVPVIGDFSLNVTNEITAEYFMQQGLQRVTASYDMNREQLLALVAATPAPWLEVVIHQHMPMFHMEHCVFCSVLSPGTNKSNCGRPCDEHLVKLRDRIGMEHPLTADVGCRNTLFNAVPQSAAEMVPTLLQHGIRNFRIELLEEQPSEIEQIIALYRRLLAGEVTGQDVWTMLRATNRVGVTRGTLETRRDPLAII